MLRHACYPLIGFLILAGVSACQRAFEKKPNDQSRDREGAGFVAERGPLPHDRGSQKARPAPSQRPDEPTTAAASVPGGAAPAHAPRRPAATWVIFREAFKPADDARCDARWTGDNRLAVTTDNIRRVTVDLNRLPTGAPRRGPWNLQIDGQGIEITGFRGKVLDLVRSGNGEWTVDRNRRRKRR